jgi:hypothetical protein
MCNAMMQLLEDMHVMYQGHSRRNGWNGPDAAMQPAAAAAADSRRG